MCMYINAYLKYNKIRLAKKIVKKNVERCIYVHICVHTHMHSSDFRIFFFFFFKTAVCDITI